MQFKIKTYISFFLILSLLACRGKYPSNHESVSVVTNTITNKETLKEVENHSNYTVATIVNCGEGIVSDVKTFTLFADYNNDLKNQSLSRLKFSGWNHTNNGSMTEWTNLKLGSNNYNFNDSTKVNSSCNNVNTLNMVLLKKVANWDHQHSNGFECDILNQGLKFGDIKNLVFDLRINSAKTNIPNVESIKSTYADYVNGTIVDALDDGKVNINITLGDSTNLNGSIIFQLDQEILNDKWVRVTIPMNKLSFYSEINYKQTPKTLADLSTVIIKRMLIMGETKSGVVLRNNINSWNNNVPETFKEMDLSFKKIELQLK